MTRVLLHTEYEVDMGNSLQKADRLLKQVKEEGGLIKERGTVPVMSQTVGPYTIDRTLRNQTDPIDLLLFEEPTLDNWEAMYQEEDHSGRSD